MECRHPFVDFRKKQQPPLSRAELADLLGVSRSYVHRIETGERRPGKDLLPLIKEKTGIAPAKLRPDLARAVEI